MKRKKSLSKKPSGNFRLRIPLVILTVLLFLIPLYPKFPLFSFKGTYVAVRVEDGVVFFALLIWFGNQIRKGFPIFKEKIFWLFLLYWGVGLISLLSSWLVTDLVSFKLSFLHFLRRVEYMSLFFLAWDGFRAMATKELSLIMALVSGLVFSYGMGQRFFGLPLISTMNEEFSKGILLYLDKWTRISATFSGHYDLAAWLVIILSLLPALIVVSRKRWLKGVLVLTALIDFYLLILTASRVSFFAYLLGISLTLILLRKHWWLLLVLPLSFFFGLQMKELNVRLATSFRLVLPLKKRIALVSPSPTPTLTPTATPLPLTRVNGGKKTTLIASEEAAVKPIKKKKLKEKRAWPKPEEVAAAAARSSQIRFAVEWPRAIRAFLKNPLLGTGYSSLGLATDNDYLRILGENGILGLLSFFLIIFHLGKTSFLALLKKKQLMAAGFLGLMAGFLANALFIDVFEASKDAFYFWLMMGIGYRVSLKNKKDLAKIGEK